MKEVKIFEIKARLSEFLDVVSAGETVVIYRRDEPIAELRPITPRRREPRPVGGLEVDVPDSFFEPLPAEVEGAFYEARPAGHGASTAAEDRRARYGSKKGRTRARR